MPSKVAKGPRPKHVPRRTCVACRLGEAKRALVRIVRQPTGAVVIDENGKVSGRGAYLCPRRDCWDLALRTGVIERALHTKLSPEDKATIESFAASLSRTTRERGD